MDLLSFQQLTQRINEAKDKIAIAHVMQALAVMPIDAERVALEGHAAKKLKALQENR